MPTLSDQWRSRHRSVTSHYVLGHSPRPMSVVKEHPLRHILFVYRSEKTCVFHCGYSYFSVCFDRTTTSDIHTNNLLEFTNTRNSTGYFSGVKKERASVGTSQQIFRTFSIPPGNGFPSLRAGNRVYRLLGTLSNGFTPSLKIV